LRLSIAVSKLKFESLFSGLDDINEFEAELEAPDKWARRFRILRESEAASQTAADISQKDDANELENSAKSSEEEGNDQRAATQAEGNAVEASATAQQDGDSTSEPSKNGEAQETTVDKKSGSKRSAEDADEDSCGKGKHDAK
jgi:hypothetical protein